jgi:NAD(P)H-dependent flavin oxidoreductase YrpB (nitropropane dioxygenase family)
VGIAPRRLRAVWRSGARLHPAYSGRRTTVTARIRTRFTEALGIQYPLIMGTMMGWSTAELVAAAANAGAFASIASSMFDTSDALREEIRRTKRLTDRPFGVNINLFPAMRPTNVHEYVDAALDEGVRVIETAGRSPEELVDRIKTGGAKLMHKCARLRDARKAESVGADIVEIVGGECGGHPSREQIGSLVLIPQVVDAVSVPVVGGGGIGDARGFVATLALGVDGVIMGTRFLATYECRVHDNMKKRMIEAQSTESVLALGSVGDPMRALKTAIVAEVLAMEERGTTLEELLTVVAGEKTRQAVVDGDIDNSLLPCGQIVGMVSEVTSIRDLIEGIMQEAEAVYDRLGGMLGKA